MKGASIKGEPKKLRQALPEIFLALDPKSSLGKQRVDLIWLRS